MKRYLLAAGLLLTLTASATAQTSSYRLFDSNTTEELNNWVVELENASIEDGSIVFDSSSVDIATQEFNVETHDTLTVVTSNLSGTLNVEVETMKNGTETNKTFTASEGTNTFDVSTLSDEKTVIKFTGSDLNGSIESFGYSGTLPLNTITGALTGSATGFIDTIVNSISNAINQVIDGIIGVIDNVVGAIRP